MFSGLWASRGPVLGVGLPMRLTSEGSGSDWNFRSVEGTFRRWALDESDSMVLRDSVIFCPVLSSFLLRVLMALGLAVEIGSSSLLVESVSAWIACFLGTRLVGLDFPLVST